jgi:pyruvate ferredoxin oxidoreductase delta subunit
MSKDKQYTNPMEHINESSPWTDITPGGFVYGEGNSKDFNTGDWRVMTPIWKPEQCKQCLLCYPVCPDSSIPVKGGKREDFDFDHCKGCAICAKVCPFGAIDVVRAGEEDKA